MTSRAVAPRDRSGSASACAVDSHNPTPMRGGAGAPTRPMNLVQGTRHPGHGVRDVDDDDPALTEYYGASYARRAGVVGAVARDRQEAEAAVQDACVRLTGRWTTVSRYDDPGAWVRKVALGFVDRDVYLPAEARAQVAEAYAGGATPDEFIEACVYRGRGEAAGDDVG